MAILRRLSDGLPHPMSFKRLEFTRGTPGIETSFDIADPMTIGSNNITLSELENTDKVNIIAKVIDVKPLDLPLKTSKRSSLPTRWGLLQSPPQLYSGKKISTPTLNKCYAMKMTIRVFNNTHLPYEHQQKIWKKYQTFLSTLKSHTLKC